MLKQLEIMRFVNIDVGEIQIRRVFSRRNKILNFHARAYVIVYF